MAGTLPALSGRIGIALALSLALVLPACQAGKEASTPNPDSSAQSISILQKVHQAGTNCWFRSKDDGFKDLQLIPELDTVYGRPRLLVLKRNRSESLPVMVIEAHGNPTIIETYGPLAQTPLGPRINADIKRWSDNNQACTA